MSSPPPVADAVASHFDPSGLAPGLIWAYRFRPGAAPVAVGAAALEAGGEGWTWIHLNLADQRCRALLAGLTSLPPAARSFLLLDEEAFGVEAEGGALHGVCADFCREFERGDTAEIGRLRFAFNEAVVVTGRRTPLVAVHDLGVAVEAGLRLEAPADVVTELIGRFTTTAGRLVRSMMADLDTIEDHVVSDEVSQERRNLVPVRRQAVGLHRQLAALTEMVREWEERAEVDGGTWALADVGRLGDRLAAIGGGVATVQERARLLQDEVAAKLAEETNRSLRTLSLMTGMMLPGSLVAGFFGMNVASLPLTDTPGGFWIAVAVAFAATWGFYMLLQKLS
ncbi:CorA family divalent cation transporter [Methylobrevis albus]|uniref:Transporter n=1 Tax=Methylobrevis albus TaxID=2793297 RepID=A0A931MXC1_9HYPH|nr:CorA family divalent cation transporter [Methylobrevis albus]MBH0236842.1 transporter [Methylobrevis albus]